MILIRLILIVLIAFLAIRAFLGFASRSHVSPKPGKDDNSPAKKVSKEIGEYVDYEEVKKEKQHSTSPKS
jgi:hypothetical protein